MSTEKIVGTIQEMVEQILAEEPVYFLVSVKIKPTNNVKVYVDGDEGITIEKCIQINRALYKQLESSGLFPGNDFSLEVSSPGLDEPLVLHRQYKKNIGRLIEVQLPEGPVIAGKLLAVNDEAIEVEETKGKNKKKETIHHTFTFAQIKQVKVQIVF